MNTDLQILPAQKHSSYTINNLNTTLVCAASFMWTNMVLIQFVSSTEKLHDSNSHIMKRGEKIPRSSESKY